MTRARTWFADYAAFVALYGMEARPDQLVCVRDDITPRLYLGWARIHCLRHASEKIVRRQLVINALA
jgi:hypothetical protein